MLYFLVLLTALLLSLATVPLAIRLAPRLGLIDRPEHRKVHTTPIPRAGGIGIALGALLPLLFALPMEPLLQSYIGGALILIFAGLCDDRYQLGHYPKFAAQVAAVALVVFHGDLYITRLPFIPPEALAPEVAIGFTIFAMIGGINSINHADGLDGLAGGESLLSIVAIALLSYTADAPIALVISLALLGGLLGFLRYNVHPARVFMGDSGSQFLGFTLAFLVIHLTQWADPGLSAALPALLLGLPIIDILAVLTQRIYGGMNWFRATRNHVHHRLLDLGFRHGESVILIYTVQATSVTAGVLLSYSSDWLILSVYLLGCAMVFVSLTLAERDGWRREHRALGADGRLRTLSPRHRALGVHATQAAAVAVALYLLSASFLTDVVPADFGVAAMAGFLLLLLAGIRRAENAGFLHRSMLYLTISVVVYLSVQYPPPLLPNLEPLQSGYLAVVGAIVLAAIGLSSEAEFPLTPTDYLVLLVLVLLGLFPQRDALEPGLAGILAQIIVLVYACELLLERLPQQWRSRLGAASLLSLGVLSIRGLLL